MKPWKEKLREMTSGPDAVFAGALIALLIVMYGLSGPMSEMCVPVAMISSPTYSVEVFSDQSHVEIDSEEHNVVVNASFNTTVGEFFEGRGVTKLRIVFARTDTTTADMAVTVKAPDTKSAIISSWVWSRENGIKSEDFFSVVVEAGSVASINLTITYNTTAAIELAKEGPYRFYFYDSFRVSNCQHWTIYTQFRAGLDG